MQQPTYEQTLEYLFAQLPMFSRIGAAAMKPDLHNTQALLAFLGNPEKQFKTIHIAGTNGKGSSSHMLAAIFQAAGYKTGLYTSPHLVDFRERIKVNGEMCSQQFVVDFTEKVKASIEDIQPSFFELTVGMAFEYFAQEKVDIAIIETGLGGRLDSTNVITPELSLITNISFDHMNILGDTLPAIAAEKAGIIKEHVPVVIGETQVSIIQVFKSKAQQLHAPIYFADQLLQVTNQQYTPQYLTLDILHHNSGENIRYTLDQTGKYQAKNILGVLTAVRILREQGWNLPEQTVQTALSQVKRLTGLRGRWEVIAEKPLTVLDVGHNEAGVGEILAQLAMQQYNKLHIVTGFVRDKDVPKALSLLPKNATYYFTQAQIPRALPYDELAVLAQQAGLTGNTYPTVKEAFAAAQLAAQPDDLLLVCGSFFIVAEVM
ncbi:dihydrofolate synthase/folylpolyglutamate synthase [Chitinophaga skermanii]|uniref:Dihydrofolate synthase/folylpolyglutamate synthase n=1 Tax=Chitinophaga skermanii TaxID=331697 RepID=A0A327QRE3_9BACT|nr:folylpolyglutamate synthase/dihydrofolate synthase family protein [Chitinophaga skermanii]RAJ06900.1 dihydrofolate synthase/folylpolyglutamate synthase [Chitinophaga skermanii]